MPRLTILDAVPSAPPDAGVIIDRPHPHAAVRAKFSRPGAFPVGALQWSSGGTHPEPTGAARALLVLDLVEHVGWLAADTDGVDPADVVKQVSFLRASDTVTLEEFRTHYRHHVEVARRHMPSLWQYVQYDVAAVDGAGGDSVHAGAAAGTVAVSVLWFRSTDDFLHRYFASREDELEFRSHEGFLDLSRAFSFVGSSHPSAAPAARP